MGSSKLFFIFSLEIIGVLLVVCSLLFMRNLSLTRIAKTIRARAKKLSEELRTLKQEKRADSGSKQRPSHDKKPSYVKSIEQQIVSTLAHHKQLGAKQDISLDIEPGVPLPYRAAALRHALLLAEKDAFMVHGREDGEPDWQILRDRYGQLFDYYETLEPSTALTKEPPTDESPRGSTQDNPSTEQVDEIDTLKRGLIDAQTESERLAAISLLEEALNKQMRYTKESETCVQLLEEELEQSHAEIDQLKARLQQLPDVKTKLLLLKKQHEETELKYLKAMDDNQQLLNQVKEYTENARETLNSSHK